MSNTTTGGVVVVIPLASVVNVFMVGGGVVVVTRIAVVVTADVTHCGACSSSITHEIQWCPRLLGERTFHKGCSSALDLSRGLRYTLID